MPFKIPSVLPRTALLSLGLLMLPAAHAQPTHTNTYGVWSKKIFADSATVPDGKIRFIFVAGMAAEDPNDGHIHFKGDFASQCRMAYQKIKDALAAQHATMSDIVRTTAYLTDMRNKDLYESCQREAMSSAPMPPHTLLGVSSLAWPDMMVEIEVTVVTANRESE